MLTDQVDPTGRAALPLSEMVKMGMEYLLHSEDQTDLANQKHLASKSHARG